MKALLKPGCPTSCPIAANKTARTSWGRMTSRARRVPLPKTGWCASSGLDQGRIESRRYSNGGTRPISIMKVYVA